MKTFLKALLICSLLMVMCVFAGEKTLNFTWEQTITPDFAGWNLYKSEVADGPYEFFATIDYVSEQSEYTSTQLVTVPDGETTTLYFILSAFDTSGNESDGSNEASITIDYQPPPIPITLTITVVTN